MADIFHRLIIETPAQDVFDGLTQPDSMNQWWTKACEGIPELGQIYHLHFGDGHDWKAIVTGCESPITFEWKFVKSDKDWMSTRVGFRLIEENGLRTHVEFHHKGWLQNDEHFRSSSYCWAMYLRHLKRFLETGAQVPYEDRLNN